MNWENLLFFLLGSAVTIGTAIAIEAMRLPRLEIRVAPIQTIQFASAVQAKLGEFLHLDVFNRSDAPAWMLPGTANRCRARIRLLMPDGATVFEMEGRWSSAPEPAFTPIYDNELRQIAAFEDRALTAMQHIDITPNEHQTLNALVRFDRESACYGWSNSSYPNWKVDAFRLDIGEYIMDVIVLYHGREARRRFKVTNDGSQLETAPLPMDDFC